MFLLWWLLWLFFLLPWIYMMVLKIDCVKCGCSVSITYGRFVTIRNSPVFMCCKCLDSFDWYFFKVCCVFVFWINLSKYLTDGITDLSGSHPLYLPFVFLVGWKSRFFEGSSPVVLFAFWYCFCYFCLIFNCFLERFLSRNFCCYRLVLLCLKQFQ